MTDPTEPDRAEVNPLPVAVIGAGFSGTMAAIQLLARLPTDRGVLLCERAEQFGPGRAYATGNPDHLLNVRAANMSAYPDRPGHFANWLGRLDQRAEPGIRVTPAGTFAARGLYGRYLTELLTGAVTGRDALRLRRVNDAIVDIRRGPAGSPSRARAAGPMPRPARCSPWATSWRRPNRRAATASTPGTPMPSGGWTPTCR